MKKILPYIYITVGVLIIVFGINEVLETKESYRLLFSFQTSNKYLYLLFRFAFGGVVIYSGFKKLKNVKQ